ncbi:MAG: BspA family leucine-rich repeat surface protein, partial [Bacteroidales bacterium]|nr:BspA family leucine-rich repeat surface protein [Bacteroidales bacterium]
VSSANYDDLIFDNCNKLIGGKGTEYTSTNTASNYAIVDGTNGKKGYLTSIDQCQPYAVLENNGETKTLKFRYGYIPNEGMKLDYLNWTQNYHEITTVAFDKLFSLARPQSCDSWFNGFTKLTSIKGIENLNTSEVTNMKNMFYNCLLLTSIDLSNFNTDNVSNMSYMFANCSAITSLNLITFKTEKVINMSGMFYGCSALKTICVDNNLWNISATSGNDMFLNCTNLVGGNGTTYNENSTDKTYALIDGSNNKPGYLTNINHQNLSIALKSGIEYTFNGKAIIPEITVTDGSQTLKLGTDYTVSTPTEYIKAGEYKDVVVTFVGEDKYIGKKSQKVTFTINPKTISTATISLNKTEFTYTGEAQTPAVKVSYLNDNGETQTLASTDYTVAYTNNTKAGKATITIAAVSGTNYTFENLTKSFDIVLKYKDPVYTWNSDYTSCTVTKEGINTATAAVTETTTNITKEILKAASTTETGKVKYTAAFENFSDDIKEVETPKLDPENNNNNENPNTPVSSITDAPVVKVWAYNKTIYITSAPDSQYKIIDLQGRIIATSTTTSTTQQIKMTRSGVYVIIINNQSFKVSL